MCSSRLKAQGRIGLRLLLPILILLIPTSWLEARPPVCLIRKVFGVKCPGCGMTRAISSLAHGDIRKAVRYNRLVVVVFPILCYTWATSLLAALRKYRLTF